jgi:hypothetical protein
MLILDVNAKGNKLPSGDEFYSEGLEIALKILKECPPETCVPIGIGRSPAPILAALSIILEDVYQVPLSNFRYHTEINEVRVFKPLPIDQEVKLFDHLTRYLPGENILKERKVLLIDYSLGGSSLFAAESYIKKYFKRIKKETQIQSFMMLRNYPDNLEHVKKLGMNKYGITEFTALNMSEYPTVDNHLLHSNLEAFAQYGSFDLKQDKRVRKNRKYAQLVKRLSIFLKRNVELQKKVSEVTGIPMTKIAQRISKVRLGCAQILFFLF